MSLCSGASTARTEGYAPVSVPDDYAQTPSGGAHPTDQHKDKRMQMQHLADQVIWWRRILYFVLLTSTLGFLLIARRLAAVPLPAGEGGAGLLDRVLVTIAEFLPEILGKWLVAVSGRPGVVIFFILLFGGLFSFRGCLKRQTNYLGNMAWNLASGSATQVPPQTLIESIAVRIKGLYLPKPVRELVRTRLFPIGVFILVLALLGFWTANLFLLPKNHMACANKRDGFTRLAAGGGPVVLTDFHSCNPWYATGIEVIEGVDYHVQLTERDEWADAGIPAGASGLEEGPSPIQDLFAITRSDPKELWFRLLGDINDRQITIGRGTRFAPERGGPLHLYVNDAVCDLCLKGVFAYYRNNRGSADITVTPIAGPATN